MMTYESINVTKNLSDALTGLYFNYFFMKYDSPDPDEKYSLTGYSLCQVALNQKYKECVEEGTITKIEDLPKERKQELWRLANKFCDDKNKRVQASISCYMLEVIYEIK